MTDAALWFVLQAGKAGPAQRRDSRALAATPGAHLAAARASCGIMAKRCLNEGRAAWLRSQPGWNNGSVRLVRFCTEADSPENFLLLGTFGRPSPPSLVVGTQ